MAKKNRNKQIKQAPPVSDSMEPEIMEPVEPEVDDTEDDQAEEGPTVEQPTGPEVEPVVGPVVDDTEEKIDFLEEDDESSMVATYAGLDVSTLKPIWAFEGKHYGEFDELPEGVVFGPRPKH